MERERAAFEIHPARLDRLRRLFAELQRISQMLRDAGFGQVVRRRAETPGSDNEIRTAHDIVKPAHDILRPVRHFKREFGDNPELQQFLPHISEIGIDDSSLEQFIADA